MELECIPARVHRGTGTDGRIVDNRLVIAVSLRNKRDDQVFDATLGKMRARKDTPGKAARLRFIPTSGDSVAVDEQQSKNWNTDHRADVLKWRKNREVKRNRNKASYAVDQKQTGQDCVSSPFSPSDSHSYATKDWPPIFN